jgi:hypothetical protein
MEVHRNRGKLKALLFEEPFGEMAVGAKGAEINFDDGDV